MWMQLCKGEHDRWDRDGRTVGGAGANARDGRLVIRVEKGPVM